MALPVGPETRIAALLDAYPGVEARLLDLVPAFRTLRNAGVWKSVAKSANVGQAARVAGLDYQQFIDRLSEAIGPLELSGGPQTGPPEPSLPAWLREDRIRCEIDADRLLEQGEHPLGSVRRCVALLQPGEIARVASSFHPAPLIDVLRRGGLAVYSIREPHCRHLTYICRACA